MDLKRLLGLARARQAFLLPDYAWRYPELPPGVWITAREVALMIRHGVESRQRPWPSLGDARSDRGGPRAGWAAGLNALKDPVPSC